ncbi:MAG: dihydropteroate synthase [Lachnospiraceae bacterium]|nr:dihydropteroate synthase [Lachnospiraceae bacterium]
MKIGNRIFDVQKHTYVMGILNVTPDSFSDGGQWLEKDKALYHVEEMLAEGMDILDVGGESTRPGHVAISAEEEISRVVPVIEAIKSRFDVPISLDTYKAEVAKAGIKAGVDLINDIWGLKKDPEMAQVIAESGVACCLMHNRKEADYVDLLRDMVADLQESLELACKAGISNDKIILDPGIGFGKTYVDNLQLLGALDRFQQLGYPLLLGTSRKSVIGLTLDLPVEERLEGTLVTTVMAVLNGYAFVRVHDIKENVRAIRMAEAIRQGGMSLYGRNQNR